MDRLAQANARLKATRTRCSIEQRGEKLLLRGTFPPKPIADRQDWHRQRIFLGVNATPVGISFAESEARKVSALLDQNLFSWLPYLEEKEEDSSTIYTQFVEKFKRHKLSQGIAEDTWKREYANICSELTSFDTEKALELVFKTSPNSRKRKRTCIAIKALFRFAGITIDLKPYEGSYSPTNPLQPRDIPSDKLVQEWFYKIPNPEWRWAYGILATYGIRPEELLLLEFDAMPVLVVRGDKSLSSNRKVYPIFLEWIELFDLKKPKIPNCKDTGQQTCRQFSRYKIPFRPYDLRHAWAIRSMEFGLPLELAAQQMGHSMIVHSQIYHRWISDRNHKQAFDGIMLREDRLKPPKHGQLSTD